MDSKYFAKLIALQLLGGLVGLVLSIPLIEYVNGARPDPVQQAIAFVERHTASPWQELAPPARAVARINPTTIDVLPLGARTYVAIDRHARRGIDRYWQASGDILDGQGTDAIVFRLPAPDPHAHYTWSLAAVNLGCRPTEITESTGDGPFVWLQSSRL